MFLTLAQFTRPSAETGEILPEDKLVKKFSEARRKDYLEMLKSSAALGVIIEAKQTVTSVTIEGEHTCMLLIRRVSDPGSSKLESCELELIPLLNAPHQASPVTITMQNIKLVLTYRYLFQRNAIRLVTHQNQEYLL